MANESGGRAARLGGAAVLSELFPGEHGVQLVFTLMSRVLTSAERFEQGWSACYMNCDCVRCILARDVRALRREVGRLGR